MTNEELSEVYGVTKRTIRRWKNNGKLEKESKEILEWLNKLYDLSENVRPGQLEMSAPDK